MKRWIAVAAVLGGSLVVTAPAEAASTSEKEGRKFSRKYLNQEVRSHDVPDADWRQRDCYRIGRDGVGDYDLFPGGVACGFTGIYRGRCVEYGVAVKDGKRGIQASNVDAIGAYRGDPADCKPNATTFEWSAQWYGVVGAPLRPFA